MKKIALFSTFCDTDEKVEILKDNILKVKSMGLDTMVISPIILPDEIINISDFVFFTKENPLLLWPTRSFTFWKTIHTSKGWVMLHHNLADYGWAGLYQVKKLSQLALSYDYDIFYHMIYDLEIDETIIEEIVTDVVNLIHPRVNPNNSEDIWEATLHFMIFDREKMVEVEKRIDLFTYLNSNGVAEGQALNWVQEIPLNISKIPIKDKIYYWKDIDFFNFGESNNFKFFISKNQETTIWVGEPPTENYLNSNLKIIFYDFVCEIDLTVLINEKEFHMKLKDNFLLDTDIKSEQIYKIEIVYENKVYDLTEKYTSINRNLIYYQE